MTRYLVCFRWPSGLRLKASALRAQKPIDAFVSIVDLSLLPLSYGNLPCHQSPMETAGFAISVVGLAALFETCLRGFELFDQSKDFGRSYLVLVTRLDAQKLLFRIWGETVGLARARRSKTLDLMKDGGRLASQVQRHLECIRIIFEDADRLCSKYGLIKTMPRKPRDPTSGSALVQSEFHSPLRRPVQLFQKQSSYQLKAKWVIQDQRKLKTMVDDLSTLLQELRQLTSAIADIQRQRNRFIKRISSSLRIRLAKKIDHVSALIALWRYKPD